MSDALREGWRAPTREADSAEELVVVDPRVITDHVAGVLPCPSNPEPPDGWRYWGGHEAVPKALAALTVKMLHDAVKYPMGSFVQVEHQGEVVAARVEWHDTRGSDGAKGCFRGVNLMRQRNNALG